MADYNIVMRTLFTFLFFLSLIDTPAFSQEKENRITNSKTPDHSSIPGYNIFLEIPEGYSRAPHFSGWQNKKGSLIILSKKEKSLKEALAEAELKLKAENYLPEKKNLRINNDAAVFVEAEGGDPSLKKNILLIEKDGISYLAESKSAESKKENDLLKKSLLTVFIEK